MLTNRLLFRRFNSWIAANGFYLSRQAHSLQHPAVLSDAFIFSRTPRLMSHASTIVSTGNTLVAAWFSGSLESRPDVGIALSINNGEGWDTPRIVATGKQPDSTQYACWNPVLFQPKDGPLLLFYKVGKDPKRWWGMQQSSHDGGKTWNAPLRLPEGIFGPIKNKPIQLANGELLSPSSAEHNGWRTHVERSSDLCTTWRRSRPLNDGITLAAIQPSILQHGNGNLQLLYRTSHGWIAESWSDNHGEAWSQLRLTSLPNPNSGTDAVSLRDGRQLLVYNRSARRRSPLNIALSHDGRLWHDSLVIARGFGEYSYPAVIQTQDGLVHITYSWNLCRVRHVVIDPEKLPHSS